ncbi:GntR family transcriptional regulator [Nocardioides coralli]|uniref:GntR family transcriptional regulator n=1 Tax=Nocardioides coralli TaxID=2872154 RepID=UPI001CA464A5|nr:GntR family transcriptional regulator [Nocardioides coralli]QZY29778.1 GntR family transcriptional regulator [Nocardioides coralli]
MRIFDGSEPPFDAISPDDRGTSPAHAWIEQWLEGQVRAGALSPGDRLPPESELAALFAVSRMTLRQALASLEEKLLIQRRRGRGGGTFVREPRVEHDLTGLPGFTEQMRRSAVRPGGIVVSATQEAPPDDVRDALELAAGEAAYRVKKVRLANDEPVALEDTWLPVAAFPELLDEDLSGSLYGLMSSGYGHVPAHALEEVEPAVADEEVAALLDVEPGALLLRVIRTTETADGVRIEFARDLFRADRARLTMTSRISSALAWGAASPAG